MALNILLILLSVMFLITSTFLYRAASNAPLSNLNMISASFWILFFLCSLPNVLIVTESKFFLEFDPRLYGDFDNRFKGWAIQIWMMIAIPIGAIIAKLFFSKNVKSKKWLENTSLKQMKMGFNFSPKLLYFSIFFYFVVYLFQVYIFSRDSNPLIVALSGGSHVDILIARNEFAWGSGSILADKLFSNDSILIFSLIAYAMKLITNEIKWKFLFNCMFIFTILTTIVGGSSSAILFYFAVIFFLRYTLIGKLLYFYELGIIIALLLSLFYFLKGGQDGNIVATFIQVAQRIFVDQGKGFYFGLQIFPDKNPFLGLSSAANWLHNILNTKTSLDYGHILMENYDANAVRIGYVGHFTSVFTTEMWANFGWPGVIGGPLWVGFVIFFVHSRFISHEKTVISLVFYAHIAITGFGYFSDFVRFYYPLNVILLYLGPLFFLASIRLITRRLPRKHSTYMAVSTN
jgi:hypothetical protein